MKKPLNLIVLLLVLILLAVTNPSRERHREALGEKVGKEVRLPGAGAVGEVFSGLYAYQNLVFFSLTRFQGEVRSVGLAGAVVTLD